MSKKKTLRCSDCGKEVSIDECALSPECCGKEMHPLPPCQKTVTAEQERLNEPDKPCDGGISSDPS